MLETTFCPVCGKPYDVSLGECPVCARKRAAEEAKRSTSYQKKKGRAAGKKTKRINVSQKVKTAIPVGETEEPTVQMDADAIRRAEDHARKMAGGRSDTPVREAVPQRTAEPAVEEGSVDKRLVLAVISALLVLVLIVFGIGNVLINGAGSGGRSGETQPAAASVTEEKKEEPEKDQKKDEQKNQTEEDQTGDNGAEDAADGENQKDSGEAGNTDSQKDDSTKKPAADTDSGNSGEASPEQGNSDTENDGGAGDSDQTGGTGTADDEAGKTDPEPAEQEETTPQDGGAEGQNTATSAEPESEDSAV